MSFENLVRIRPVGFESKNIILANATLSVIAYCILVALPKMIEATTDPLIRLKTRKLRVIIPKVIGYHGSYCSSFFLFAQVAKKSVFASWRTAAIKANMNNPNRPKAPDRNFKKSQ